MGRREDLKEQKKAGEAVSGQERKKERRGGGAPLLSAVAIEAIILVVSLFPPSNAQEIHREVTNCQKKAVGLLVGP